MKGHFLRDVHESAINRLIQCLPNKTVVEMLKCGAFTVDDPAIDGLHRRRLLEYEKIHQSRALKRSIEGAAVVNALTNCSPQRPSGILCSPSERFLRSHSDKRLASSDFFDAPEEHLHF
ncbi:MAG: hypothetical protein VW395_09575, partial [Methylotenera sp.]